jgi:hypothetical protein
MTSHYKIHNKYLFYIGIVTVFETDGTQKKFFGMSALVILANLSFIILGQLITVHL